MTTMMGAAATRRRPGALGRLGAVGALAFVLALTGCSDDEDSGAIASASDPTAGASTGAAEGASTDEEATDDRTQMFAFTQCLRENGLDINDPAPGEGLRLQFGPGTDQATVQAAMEACRELSPQGGTAGGPGGGDASIGLEHAQCMRDNGVEAFPDPSQPGMIQINPEIAQDPDYEAAEQACSDILGGGGPVGGAGS